MNMNTTVKAATVVLFAGMVFSLFAATYTWVPGSTNWRSESSYVDEHGVTPVAQLPGGEDTVKFDGTQTVVIDDDDFPFVSALKCLSPLNNGVTLEFDLSKDGCLDADVCNADGSGNFGKLVKKGVGALQLGDAVLSGNTVSNYRLHEVVVDNGMLISPTNIPAYRHFGGDALTVNESGTFVIPSPGNFRFSKVFGSGTISNLVGRSGATQFMPQGAGSVFDGKLVGSFYYVASAGIDLTGTESTINNGFTIYGLNAAHTLGTVGVVKLGEKGTASSVGKNSTIVLGSGDGSACLRYLGAGEWTNRKFALGATKGEPITIDGGAYGGLHFASDGIVMNWAGMIPLVLDGSNTVNACVISNSIACKSANGTNYTVQITKKGTGKWRFTNAENAMAGAIAVENGTLQFDSLAKRGTSCALGTATLLYKPTYGLALDENKVNYAYLLGSAKTRGMMEYLGEGTSDCPDRPVRLTGRGGGFVANGGILRVGDFASADTAGSTLVLSGGNAVENVASVVTDGEGSLSVAKEGSNTWVLGGKQDFSGSLEVKQGTLIARNNKGQKYSWYRIWFMEKGSSSPKYSGLESGYWIQVTEFSLKDDSGVQQNVCTGQKSDWTALEPGECAPETAKDFAYNTAAKNLLSMFDGQTSSWAQCGNKKATYLIGQPETWFGVVVRLPTDADEVTAFDMIYQQGGASNQYIGRNPTAVSIEASVDGVAWDPVGSATDLPIEIGASWLSAKSPCKDDPSLLALSSAVQTRDETLSKVGPISVSSGATLRFEGTVTPISKLKLSATGNGTIENATFASSGSLTVEGAERGKAISIPVTFKNCINIGNIANWTLRYGDTEMPRYSIKVNADGSIVICPPGLVLIVR